MAAAKAMIQGMDFVKDQLEGFLPRESKAILRRTTAAIAREVRDEIRKRAPVRRGILRRAIIAKRDRGTRDQIEASVWITKGTDAKYDAFYWHMVEWGTKTAKAKPFIEPVVEGVRPTYKQDLGTQLNKQIKKQLEKRAKSQKNR